MPTNRCGELSSRTSFFSGPRPSRLSQSRHGASKGHVAAKGNTRAHIWRPICGVMTNAVIHALSCRANLRHDQGGFEIGLRNASEAEPMPPATARRIARDIPPLRAPYAPPDEGIASALLASADRPREAETRIDTRTRRLVEAIRARAGGLGGVEDFLHAYALSTKEGLALMVLAEALLRVPDSETADLLIEDKLQAGDWVHHGSRSAPLLVSASAWTLGLTVKVIHPGETPEGIVDALIKRLGLPAVRAATRQAMRLLGSHFVLGQTIEEALARAGSHREFHYSLDMLGDGARYNSDAEHYLDSYAHAIEAI